MSPDTAPVLLAAAQKLEDQRLLQASRDEDTATVQRVRVYEAIGALIGRTERTPRPFAVLMIAANALDAINTHSGFDVGDQLIAAIGRLLKAKLGSDAAIWRYGSNTFAAVVDDCAPSALTAASEALIEAVADANHQTTAGPLKATVSIGGVAVPVHAGTVGEAVSHALTALDHAKQQPGSFVAHRPGTTAVKALERDQSLTRDLLSALDENRIRIVLQPIVDATSRKPALYEVLLRLELRDGTRVAAFEFIEEAEKLGLARLLDRRALELALAVLKDHPTVSLSLNISSQTAGDKTWIGVLRAACMETPALPSRLTVEITETAMIHDIDRISSFVDLLHSLGCKVAIDDFGAGYTSFRHLKALKVDMLKIDGMFMADLTKDPQNQALVKSMIEIANAFGLKTVAEWVTDEPTAAFLQTAGVTYLQGFLHGRPISVSDF